MIIYLIFIAVNILIAWVNKNIVESRMSTGTQINHFAWACYYCAPIVVIHLIRHDWFFTGALSLLHLSVFPVAYNRFRKLYAFFLSEKSSAISDKLQVWLKQKDSKKVNIGSFVVSAILLIISLVRK